MLGKIDREDGGNEVCNGIPVRLRPLEEWTDILWGCIPRIKINCGAVAGYFGFKERFQFWRGGRGNSLKCYLAYGSIKDVNSLRQAGCKGAYVRERRKSPGTEALLAFNSSSFLAAIMKKLGSTFSS